MASVKKNKGKRSPVIAKGNKGGNQKNIIAFSVISIVVLTFIVYYNSLHNLFVTNLDDTTYIASVESLKKLAFSDIYKMFSTVIAGNYHPLAILSLTIDYHFFGMNAFPFHLVNLLMHLANVALVFWFVFLLVKRVEAAVIVSILFAIHPMHVESVSWISERKDVLYTLFFLASLISYLFYVRHEKKYRYLIFSLILFCLSLLSKPAAVCLAPVVVLMDYYLKRKFDLKTIFEKVPYFLLALAFGIITIWSQKSFGALSALSDFHYVFSLFDRIFLVSYAVMFYLVKTVAPFYLCAIYYYPQKSGDMLPMLYYLAPLGLALIAFMIFWFKKIRKELIFGLAFFLITIALVLQFVPVGFTIVSERYTYVPYIGLFFIVGKLYCDYTDNKFGNFTKAGRNAIIFLITGIVILFSVLTVQRNKVWANGITLFDDVVKKNPSIGHAYWARGVGKFDLKDIEGALADYTLAIDSNYRFPVAYNNKANCYYMMDSLKQAIIGYNEALKVNDQYAMAYYNRGMAKQKLNDFEGSIDDYLKSIKYNFENLSWSYNGLGYSYFRINELSKALTSLCKAIEIDPEYADAYYYRGLVENEKKEYATAINDFTKAIEFKANYATAYYNRGIMRIQLKDTVNACNDFSKSLDLGYAQANDALKIYSRKHK